MSKVNTRWSNQVWAAAHFWAELLRNQVRPSSQIGVEGILRMGIAGSLETPDFTPDQIDIFEDQLRQILNDRLEKHYPDPNKSWFHWAFGTDYEAGPELMEAGSKAGINVYNVFHAKTMVYIMADITTAKLGYGGRNGHQTLYETPEAAKHPYRNLPIGTVICATFDYKDPMDGWIIHRVNFNGSQYQARSPLWAEDDPDLESKLEGVGYDQITAIYPTMNDWQMAKNVDILRSAIRDSGISIFVELDDSHADGA